MKITEIVVEGCASESDALAQAKRELPEDIVPISAVSLSTRDCWAVICQEETNG